MHRKPNNDKKINRVIQESRRQAQAFDMQSYWKDEIRPDIEFYTRLIGIFTSIKIDSSLPAQENDLSPEEKEKKLNEKDELITKQQNARIFMANVDKKLTRKLTYLLELYSTGLITVNSRDVEIINSYFDELTTLCRLLLKHYILISALNLFSLDVEIRDRFQTRAVPKTDNRIRENHIDSIRQKFECPETLLGLVDTAVQVLHHYNNEKKKLEDLKEKNISEYLKEKKKSEELIEMVKSQLEGYLTHCHEVIERTNKPRQQLYFYYDVCLAAKLLFEQKFEEAATIFEKCHEANIKEDVLKEFILATLVQNYFLIGQYFSQEKNQCLYWLNKCKKHLDIFPEDMAQFIVLKIQQLENEISQNNKTKLAALSETTKAKLTIKYDEAAGICKIQLEKRSEGYLLEKALNKKNNHNIYIKKDTTTFEIPLAYLSITTIEKAFSDIERLQSNDEKAPFITPDLVDSLPTLNSSTTSTLTILQSDEEKTRAIEKEAKLNRHLENEQKRQAQLETVGTKKTAEENVTKPQITSTETKSNEEKDEDEEENNLSWHKNYPAVKKDETKNCLVVMHKTQKCYYHFFLSEKIKKEIAKNHEAVQKVTQLLDDPNQSTGKQGMILTSDRAGNRMFKLKMCGHGNGNAIRITGYVDDVIYDEDKNPHFAVDLNNTYHH